MTAAAQAVGVRRVLVVCEDERIPAALAGTGVECVDERGLPGLNAALAFGAEYLGTPNGTVGALQADLPALRPADLSAAIEEAAGRRAYCADRPGAGTTLLLAAPGEPLHPRFGRHSADAHAATGAVRIGGSLASLRCDVDTKDDLAVAAQIGLEGSPFRSMRSGLSFKARESHPVGRRRIGAPLRVRSEVIPVHRPASHPLR